MYLLFVGSGYSGFGWDAYVGAFPSIKEAREAVKGYVADDWAHIVKDYKIIRRLQKKTNFVEEWWEDVGQDSAGD